MFIPFLPLKNINASYEVEFKSAFDKFLNSGNYILGRAVKEFESNFADYCHSDFSIGVANGLDALILALESFDLPPNSEIIVPANTYFASILAVIRAGHAPILVDPSSYDYLLEPDDIRRKITSKTKAILAVNLYGRACDFDKLRVLCDENKLKLLVDAAQSHGALYRGTRNCPGADAVAYSFYPSKNLGALSDAGAVVTHNADIAEKIKRNRNYGSLIKYEFETLGHNSRLSELQAMFLNIKLKYLDLELAKRRAIAQRYIDGIKNDKIILPPNDRIFEDSWHLFAIRTKNRQKLIEYLNFQGIGTDIHYPIPPHKQKALGGFSDLHLPITKDIHNTILSIPINSTLKENEVDYIISSLNSY
jgi:dTDP-4-amino-4,6-dideoxygalactose transaminase